MIGALNDHYLRRDRPLGESRTLFEIGNQETSISDLRAKLGLDSGYLSRMLRSLERQGLVTTRSALRDKRIREVRLTEAGALELNELDRRSDRVAQAILDPLNETQRARLIEAMAQIERLLSAAAVQIEEKSPASRDAQYCLSNYFVEIAKRFEAGFNPAHSMAPTLDDFAPPLGTFLVMRLRGEPVGCGGFKPMDNAAYIKRMWIVPRARGLGLGRRLLEALEDRARALGYGMVRLETHRALTESHQLYRSSGYQEVVPFNDETYAHHWFEKPLMRATDQ